MLNRFNIMNLEYLGGYDWLPELYRFTCIVFLSFSARSNYKNMCYALRQRLQRIANPQRSEGLL